MTVTNSSCFRVSTTIQVTHGVVDRIEVHCQIYGPMIRRDILLLWSTVNDQLICLRDLQSFLEIAQLVHLRLDGFRISAIFRQVKVIRELTVAIFGDGLTALFDILTESIPIISEPREDLEIERRCSDVSKLSTFRWTPMIGVIDWYDARDLENHRDNQIAVVTDTNRVAHFDFNVRPLNQE